MHLDRHALMEVRIVPRRLHHSVVCQHRYRPFARIHVGFARQQLLPPPLLQPQLPQLPPPQQQLPHQQLQQLLLLQLQQYLLHQDLIVSTSC